MKVFHCSHCRHVVFFENTHCVNCGHTLAYVPNLSAVVAMEPLADGLWRMPVRAPARRRYRLCQNYAQENICNWAVAAEDPQRLCESCRLTQVIPNLAIDGNREAWFKLEAAKRRLIYSLMQLGCPIETRLENPAGGLAYEFLSDADAESPVLTGHAHGVVTVNIAEADDAERERRRLQMGEPYRTLLGHFRHRSATIIGSGWCTTTAAGWNSSGACSAMSAPTMRQHCTRTTRMVRPSTGHRASSVPMRAHIHGRTGPKAGRTTCT